ncbi:MAG: T9SS type A sorting domain-containing protein [Ignavibacteria bacterium]|nr:T9SS type A sorting domain-containing protein [Ignavibacteria bacterium]
MKKIFSLVLVLMFVAGMANSQTFQFYRHSPRIIYGDTSLINATVAIGYFKNMTSTNQNFKFVRVLNSLPGPTWQTSICVEYCYASDQDTIPPRGAQPVTRAPNVLDSIQIDFLGHTPGLATVIIKAYLESNPSNFLVDTFRVQLGTVGIRQISSVIDGYKLEQNYPNPFNPSTKINFSIAKAERVSLKVYDILGNEVANLIPDKISQPGTFAVEFNSNDFKMSSGVYYYTLRTGSFVSTKKMLLVK